MVYEALINAVIKQSVGQRLPSLSYNNRLTTLIFWFKWTAALIIKEQIRHIEKLYCHLTLNKNQVSHAA